MKRFLAAFCNTRTALAFVTGLSVMACIFACVASKAQQPNIHKYSDITTVPRPEVDKWLKSEVAQNRGNWDKDRYSFYIGFSTGGYASDPVTGIAMTRLAFGLMNNTLAVGDRITPIAWELKDESVGQTIKLTDATSSRGKFVDSVPGAPFPNSDGGHDIERTLYDTISQHIPPAERSSSIVILLTTSNQSMASNHGKDIMFGSPNKLLTDALTAGHWNEPTRAQFTFGSEKGPVTIYATGLFPKKLTSLPDASGSSRYPTFALNTWQPAADKPGTSEALPNKTVSATVQASPVTPGPPVTPIVEHRGVPLWVWALLAVLIVGVILFMVMGKRSGVQRPLQPVAAVVAAPKIETIPGSLRVVIGPDEQTISPLVKGAAWSVTRQSDGTVKLIDTSKSGASKTAATASPGPAAPAAAAETSPAASGMPLARLSFGDDRSLHATADSGAQFGEFQGTAADKCDSRALLVEPGKKIVCRVLPPDAASKTRLEIVYDTQAGKGSKV